MDSIVSEAASMRRHGREKGGEGIGEIGRPVLFFSVSNFFFEVNAFLISYNSQRYDRIFALLDARVPTKVTKHSLQADPECLLWNPHNPAQVRWVG